MVTEDQLYGLLVGADKPPAPIQHSCFPGLVDRNFDALRVSRALFGTAVRTLVTSSGTPTLEVVDPVDLALIGRTSTSPGHEQPEEKVHGRS